MRHHVYALPVVFSLCVGCGKPAPPLTPEAKVKEAARVFAVAQDLENGKKTKQAMDAYRQVVQHFPGTPEASKAAKRISEVQRAAIQKGPQRKSK
jgi:outer membrane protein assembly factor BamD (BamD/ComL family)